VRRRALLLLAPILLAAPRAEARGCHERSEIVGKQRCSRFGDPWDVSRTPAFVVGLGPSVIGFPVAGTAFDATVEQRQGDGIHVRVGGGRPQRWVAFGAPLRLAIFAPRVFYLGAEGFTGGAFFPADAAVPTSVPQGKPLPAFAVHETGAGVRSLGVITGVSLPAWRFDFSLESMSGFRTTSPDLAWQTPHSASKAAGGCWQGSRGATFCPSIDAGWTYTARVEPRAGIGFRITPWVTLRALGGFDLVTRGAWSAALLVEAHTRVYDAFFQRRHTADPE
jgi:hypothetical protein